MAKTGTVPIAEGDIAAPLKIRASLAVPSMLPTQTHDKEVGGSCQLNLVRPKESSRVGGITSTPVRHVFVWCDVATGVEHHTLNVVRVDQSGGERELAITGRKWTSVGTSPCGGRGRSGWRCGCGWLLRRRWHNRGRWSDRFRYCS